MASLLQRQSSSSSGRQVRGGWRQRLAAEDLDRSRSPTIDRNSGISSLRRWLLDYSWGEINAFKFGEYCAAAKADGMQHPLLLRVAKTAEGASSHNVSRQLESILVLRIALGL